MKNKVIGISILSVALIVLFFVGSSLYKKSEKSRIGNLAIENAELFAPDHSPVFGDPSAKIIITEFLDPECESCRRFYPKVKKLLEMYDGKVKLVVRYAAFHRNSKHAIKVLEATRNQGKYWESLGLLFDYQPGWASHHNPQPKLVFKYLSELGLDIDKLKKDMHAPSIDKIIEEDAKDLKELKVRGTPTFFVNGKPLEKFGIAFLYSAVDAEVKKLY